MTQFIDSILVTYSGRLKLQQFLVKKKGLTISSEITPPVKYLEKQISYFFSRMFVHSHENNIESRSDIFAIFVSEDVKEIIEDTLQNKGTVEIVMARHQDLGLV